MTENIKNASLDELLCPASKRERQPDAPDLVAGIRPASITIIGGETNIGKTSLVLAGLVAPYSAGRQSIWASDNKLCTPGRIVVICAENSGYQITEIIRRNGGNLDNVVVIDAADKIRLDTEGCALTVNGTSIEHICAVYRPDMLVLDPVLEFVGGRLKQNDNDSARSELMRPLRRMATTYNVAIVATMHGRKGAASSAADKIAGASAVSNASDALYYLQQMDGPDDLILTCDKYRTSPFPPSLRLRRDGIVYTVIGRSRTRAADVFASKARKKEAELAEARSTATQRNRDTARAAILAQLSETGAVSEDTAARRSEFETAILSMVKVRTSTIRSIIADLAVDGMVGTARGRVWLIPHEEVASN